MVGYKERVLRRRSGVAQKQLTENITVADVPYKPGTKEKGICTAVFGPNEIAITHEHEYGNSTAVFNTHSGDHIRMENQFSDGKWHKTAYAHTHNRDGEIVSITYQDDHRPDLVGHSYRQQVHSAHQHALDSKHWTQALKAATKKLSLMPEYKELGEELQQRFAKAAELGG